MPPWNDIVRLLTPPRMRSGDLMMAMLDSLLHRTIGEAQDAEHYRDTTIAQYSNIGQREVLQRLLNQHYPGHNIRIEGTETGSILLFERPDYTPNHTYRQIAGGNYTAPVTSSGSGLTVIYTGGAPSTIYTVRRTLTHGGDPLIISAQHLAFNGIDFIIHQTGMSSVEIEALRHFVQRIVFLGVTFEITTP